MFPPYPEKKNLQTPTSLLNQTGGFLCSMVRGIAGESSPLFHTSEWCGLLVLILLSFSFYLPLLTPFVLTTREILWYKMRQFCSIEDLGVLSILTYLIDVFYRVNLSIHDYILPFNLQLNWSCCAWTVKAVQLLTFSPLPLTENC